jgi:hypothetical protein
MKSFLEGKKSLAAEPLRPALAPGAALAPRCEGARESLKLAVPGPAESHVEVVKEGDKIVRLIVTCVCGERVEVECLYPGGR